MLITSSYYGLLWIVLGKFDHDLTVLPHWNHRNHPQMGLNSGYYGLSLWIIMDYSLVNVYSLLTGKIHHFLAG